MSLKKMPYWLIGGIVLLILFLLIVIFDYIVICDFNYHNKEFCPFFLYMAGAPLTLLVKSLLPKGLALMIYGPILDSILLSIIVFGAMYFFIGAGLVKLIEIIINKSKK
ncbi:hypothetical protein ACFL6I_21470 [candidate division KSB1 bacterium]